MPVELGGSGLGVTEAAIAMQAVAESGAGFSGASALHLNIFGPMPLAKFGTEAQKQKLIPALIRGEDRMCFGVTEPNAGLDTTSLTTKAVRTNEGYVISGRKMWTTMAQRATKMLILARTTPKAEVKRPPTGSACSTSTSTARRSTRRRSRRWGARRSSRTRCSSTTCTCRPTPWWARRARLLLLLEG